MTQKERVLAMLRHAGTKGLRSDEFIAAYMPRAAARVQELKDEGYDISSEREGRWVRWTLNVGDGAGVSRPQDDGRIGTVITTADNSTASGVAASSRPSSPRASEAPPESLFDLPPAPNAFDPWERAA